MLYTVHCKININIFQIQLSAIVKIMLHSKVCFSLVSTESKSPAQPLDLAPPVGEDEELTPEEVQMVQHCTCREFM